MFFDPKKSYKETISIRIDLDTIERLDDLAGRYDISRNQLVVQCIKYALDNMKKE